MVNHVNWMQPSQGSVLPTEGNPVAAPESPTTGVATAVAPEGAQYASVWATVDTLVEATNLTTSLGSGIQYALPANTVLQIPNITVKKTTIEMTDI